MSEITEFKIKVIPDMHLEKGLMVTSFECFETFRKFLSSRNELKEENARLKAELGKLGNDKASNDSDYLKLSYAHNKVIKENARIREALEFYADLDNWAINSHVFYNHTIYDILEDFGGRRAREALGVK